jgi:hypothetical protein
MQTPDAKTGRADGAEGQGGTSGDGTDGDQHLVAGSASPVTAGRGDSRHHDELAIARRRQAWADFWRAHWGAGPSGSRH